MIHALMMIAHRGSDAVIEADAGEAEEQSERLACRHLVAQNRNSRANREHLFEYARDRDGQAGRVLHDAQLREEEQVGDGRTDEREAKADADVGRVGALGERLHPVDNSAHIRWIIACLSGRESHLELRYLESERGGREREQPPR